MNFESLFPAENGEEIEFSLKERVTCQMSQPYQPVPSKGRLRGFRGSVENIPHLKKEKQNWQFDFELVWLLWMCSK